MSTPTSPWGTPADGETWSRTFDDTPTFQRLREAMKQAHEARVARSRRKLLQGVDSDFRTLRDARGSLSPQEQVQVLRLATSPARPVPPVSAIEDERATHEVRARDCNLAAAALASYLANEVARLSADERAAPAQHMGQLFSVLLVQRQLEQERPIRFPIRSLETDVPGSDQKLPAAPSEDEAADRPMLRSDFYLGMEFLMSGARWRCTDVGSRVVVAIMLEPHDDLAWYNGPPYCVLEVVLDEYDIAGCELPRRTK